MSAIEEKVKLTEENAKLLARVRELEAGITTTRLRRAASGDGPASQGSLMSLDHSPALGASAFPECLTIIVLGASGDLAFKKTYPALYSLFLQKHIPSHLNLHILGYARSPLDLDKFIARISSKFKGGNEDTKKAFLSHCSYIAGQYDKLEDYEKMNAVVQASEEKRCPGGPHHRIFYFALPPSVFDPVSTNIDTALRTKNGYNRIIVEKPFGRDYDSAVALHRQISSHFDEPEIFRIDHYLGKEMVQNLMILRFANRIFEPLWNAQHIQAVIVTFKEDFGTQGRGGYFDSFGIIRDVMQNHLLQILSLVAMEEPVSMSAEDIRDEKVKVLKRIPPIEVGDVVIGQYGKDPKGLEVGYLDDETVPKDSITPTYAAAVLHIQNSRWGGNTPTPFILKCGKALDSKKAEIRIQFRRTSSQLFNSANPTCNELVMRIQPDESIWWKMMTKEPGLKGGLIDSELDLNLKDRFPEASKNLPDAYERLILDVIKDDHSLFVRGDELMESWKIFTSLLHKLEKDKVKPLLYPYGSRGPPEGDELVKRYGFVRNERYDWGRPQKL